MYTMKIDLPTVAKGADVEIDGLGVFANGSEYEISDEEARDFRAHHTTQSFEHDEDGNLIVTQKQGPTVAQAFRGHKHIDVTVVKGDNDDPDDDEPDDTGDNDDDDSNEGSE